MVCPYVVLSLRLGQVPLQLSLNRHSLFRVAQQTPLFSQQLPWSHWVQRFTSMSQTHNSLGLLLLHQQHMELNCSPDHSPNKITSSHACLLFLKSEILPSFTHPHIIPNDFFLLQALINVLMECNTMWAYRKITMCHHFVETFLHPLLKYMFTFHSLFNLPWQCICTLFLSSPTPLLPRFGRTQADYLQMHDWGLRVPSVSRGTMPGDSFILTY